MRSNLRLPLIAKVVALVLAIFYRPSLGCLRDTLDDRAVQWSTSIVLANLTTVHDPQPLADPIQYQVYDFEITSVIDGSGKVGDTIHIVRFISSPDTMKSSICGEALGDKQIGKSFLLMLRPEADLHWSGSQKNTDPRTPELHAMKAFVVVHLELAYDLGAEGLDDAKYTISSTRAAEAQFKADDAKLQVQTMINAADDTEESQAEQALLDMGPKALPVLNDALASADESGKGRLNKVIREISPPTLLASMHQH